MDKHNISIDGKLWSDIKSFCDTNGLKLNVYCEKLLREAFLSAKFGDIPFGVIGSNTGSQNSPENEPKFEIPAEIMERATKRIKKMQIEGAFSQTDNVRVYEKDNIEKEVNRFNEAIKNGEPMGELKHPEPTVDDYLKKVEELASKMEGTLPPSVEILTPQTEPIKKKPTKRRL